MLARTRCIQRPLRRNLSIRPLIKELELRGLIEQISEPKDSLQERLELANATTKGSKQPVLSVYCGVDPSAPSLHLGNLVPLMVLLHFYMRGHNVVPLVGGATGRVGDPSGRTTERSISNRDPHQVHENVAAIKNQLQKFFQNAAQYCKVRHGLHLATLGTCIPQDNLTWWEHTKLVDFLAQYGPHIRVAGMFHRESVTARLKAAPKGSGIGFHEFAYQILQAYDFYHLYTNYNVCVQVGGSDQWGNMTAGIDLIRRLAPQARTKPVHAITVPLLKTSAGVKFGKSAGNAVFISKRINPPYDVYQYFVNQSDEDVGRLLKTFTMLPLDQIDNLIAKHFEAPHLREAQRTLAHEVVGMLYDDRVAQEAELVSNVLFGKIGPQESEVLERGGHALSDLFREAKVLKQVAMSHDLVGVISELVGCSAKEARRKISQGSIYLGSKRHRVQSNVTDWSGYLVDQLLMVWIGKHRCFIVELR